MPNFAQSQLYLFLKSRGLDKSLPLSPESKPALSQLAALRSNPTIASMADDDKELFDNALADYLASLDDENTDTADARAREIALLNAGEKNTTQQILAITGIIAFFIMAGYIIINGIREMSSEASFIVGSVTGTIGGIAVTIYNYYFGSSKGSYDKTKTINNNIARK